MLVRVMSKTVITCYLRPHSHVVPLQNVMSVCDCMYTQHFVLVKIVHMELIHLISISSESRLVLQWKQGLLSCFVFFSPDIKHGRGRQKGWKHWWSTVHSCTQLLFLSLLLNTFAFCTSFVQSFWHVHYISSHQYASSLNSLLTSISFVNKVEICYKLICQHVFL